MLSAQTKFKWHGYTNSPQDQLSACLPSLQIHAGMLHSRAHAPASDTLLCPFPPRSRLTNPNSSGMVSHTHRWQQEVLLGRQSSKPAREPLKATFRQGELAPPLGPAQAHHGCITFWRDALVPCLICMRHTAHCPSSLIYRLPHSISRSYERNL